MCAKERKSERVIFIALIHLIYSSVLIKGDQVIRKCVRVSAQSSFAIIRPLLGIKMPEDHLLWMNCWYADKRQVLWDISCALIKCYTHVLLDSELLFRNKITQFNEIKWDPKIDKEDSQKCKGIVCCCLSKYSHTMGSQ